MRDSDSTSFLVVNHNLALAFKRLFNHHGGYPRFKSRHYVKQAYTGRSVCKVEAKRRMKLPKLGSMRTSKTGQLVNAKIKRYTITYDPTGRYYLSLQVETNIDQLPKTGKTVGVDVGLHDMAITSEGLKYSTFYANWEEKQTTRWQAKFSKRKHLATVAVRQWNHEHKATLAEIEDYQNWQRARQVKARYQARIAHKRQDHLQKITTELVKRYDTIVIEDLKTKNLQKNHHLASSIVNASWRLFRTMLEYKCAWYGKRLVIVKPNYTTQTCSKCGFRMGTNHTKKIVLGKETWDCPQCGTHHDRDINAAINILNRGLNAIG